MRKRAMPPPLLFDNVVMVAVDVFRVALSVAATASIVHMLIIQISFVRWRDSKMGCLLLIPTFIPV